VTPPHTGWPYLDDPGTVLAFAHRGGAYHPGIEGLENTMAAFRLAAGLGYGYIETDVRVTSDGVLVVFHDEMLDRMTDRVGPIAEVTWAELAQARIGGKEEVPRLADLFDELPHVRFNIDVKSEPGVEALADFIRRRNAWDRVLVAAFDGRRLRRFRTITEGRVATSAHPAEAAAYRLMPSARLARRATWGGPAALQVPHHRGPVTVVTEGFLRRAHAAGLHVHVWTIDDAAEMHELLDRGVDGLMSDRTDVLRQVFLERGIWTGGDA
jgi:glycerophosphoryl diester phosphodiesterase